MKGVSGYRLNHNNIHHWLRYNFGPASKCESKTCAGLCEKYEYALIKGKEHIKDRASYIMLCKTCHMKYDHNAKTHSEIARLGAIATNKILTPAKRSSAAKKGWDTRKKNEKKAKQTRRARAA